MITCRNNVRLEMQGGEHLEPFARKKLAELKAMRKQNRYLPNNRNIISDEVQIYLEDNEGRMPDLIRIQGRKYAIYSYNPNDNLYDALFTDNQDSVPLVVNGMANGFMREAYEHGNVLCKITLKTCYGPLNPVAAFHYDGTQSFYQSQLDPMSPRRWRFVKRFFSRSRERNAVFLPLFVSKAFAVATITDSTNPAYDFGYYFGAGRPNKLDVELSGNRCFALREDTGDRVYLEAIAGAVVFRSAVTWRGDFPDDDRALNIQIALPEKERERFQVEGLIRYAAWSVGPWFKARYTWNHDNPDGTPFGNDETQWSSVFGWEYGVFVRSEKVITIQPYNNDQGSVPYQNEPGSPQGYYYEDTMTVAHGNGWAQRATLYCRGEQVFANTVPLSCTSTYTVHANFDSRYESGVEVREPDEFSATTMTSGASDAIEWRAHLNYLDEEGRPVLTGSEFTIGNYAAHENTAGGSMYGFYGIKPDGLLHHIGLGDVVEVTKSGAARLIVPQPAVDDPQDDHLFSIRKLHRTPKDDEITLVKVVPEEIEKHIEPRYWMALLFRGKYPRQVIDGTEYVRVTEDDEKDAQWVQVVWLQNVLMSGKAGTVVVRNDLLPSEELPYFVAFCLYAKRADQSKKHFLIADMPFVH